MDRFSKFHPIINFTFFISVIILTLIYVNPVFLFISFICSFAYLLKLNGKKEFFSLFKFVIPLVIFVAAFNTVFARYGSTVMFSIKSFDFTFESFIYGICTGLMFASVIMWFSAYNAVVTGEKIIVLFGRFAPNTVLLFSMVLRFIPLMKKTADQIKETQIGIGEDISGLKNTLNRFSTLVSISLEKSIETADTMKARGFGNKRRSVYSRYGFKFNDAVVLLFVVVLFLFCLFAKIFGAYAFSYNPVIEFKNAGIKSPIIFFLLCFMPLLVDFTEDFKWLYLKSKI